MPDDEQKPELSPKEKMALERREHTRGLIDKTVPPQIEKLTKELPRMRLIMVLGIPFDEEVEGLEKAKPYGCIAGDLDMLKVAMESLATTAGQLYNQHMAKKPMILPSSLQKNGTVLDQFGRDIKGEAGDGLLR